MELIHWIIIMALGTTIWFCWQIIEEEYAKKRGQVE